MLQIILGTFIIFNLIVSFTKKNSKILIWISTIFIAVVFTGSRDMADWPNYYSDYIYRDGNYKNNGQFIYYYIIEIFKFLKFSFDAYRFWISIICLSIYNSFIFKYSPKPNLVYAAYLSYLIFLDDVQIRNFIACSVFVLGLSVIIQHKKNWRIKYFIICSIAALIHNSFWIYLIFLFIPSDLYDWALVKKIGFIGLILIVISVFVRPFISNLLLALSFVIGDKASSYSESEIGLGGIIYFFIQLVAIVGLYYIFSNFKNTTYSSNIIRYNSAYKILTVILMLDILSLVCIPPIILAITFNRLIRNLFILNVVGLTLGIKNHKTRLLSTCVYIVYTGLFIYFELTSTMIQNIVIEPFFNNNIYF